MGTTGTDGTYHPFYSVIPLSLHDFREVDANGDVGAIAANGGILASDTTPVMGSGATTNIGAIITWATGNVDPIAAQIALPDDFDGSQDVLVDLLLASGTTNAASIVVGQSWDAGATVNDTADDAATKSATPHKVTARIAAADIPDRASFVTLMLTPPTHATDTIQLHGAKLRYLPRVVS